MSLGSSGSPLASSLAAASDSEGDGIVISSRSHILISPRRISRRRSSSHHSHRRSSYDRKVRVEVVRPASPSESTGRRRTGSDLNEQEAGGEDSDAQCGASLSIDSSSRRPPPRPRMTQNKEDDSGSGSSDSEQEQSSRSASRGSPDRKAARRAESTKHTTNKDANAFSALDKASNGSLEELKLTLKKLAHQTDREHSTASSSVQLSDYIRAMPSLESLAKLPPPSEQLRLAEYLNDSTSVKPLRHASFQSPTASPRWSDPRLRKSKSIALGSNRFDSASAPPYNGESSFHKKLFAGNNYPPGGGATAGTAAAATGSAQGSRALVSALKALQDKIRRLEEERASLMQELSDVKVKARKQEAELASKEKKFAYELGQTKESARAAYDAVRMEREELRLDLAKTEEREKAMQNEIEHVKALAKTFSAKADDLGTQLQISEKHRARLESDMDKKDRESERVIRKLKNEIESVRGQFEKTQAQLEATTAQYESELTSHKSSKERLRESEQTVAALSQLHEKMVAKVWEATEAANSATKKNKKLMQQQRVSTLARPTASSAANSAGASALTARRYEENGGSLTSNTAGTRNPPRRMDSSTSATSKTKKKVIKSTKSTGKAAKKTAPSANNMTLLREANLGRDVPFLLGNSSSRSFSVIGNVQDAIHQCDTTYVAPVLNGASPASTVMANKQKKKVDGYESNKQGVSASILQGGSEFLRGSGGNATPCSTRPRPGNAGFKKNKPDAIKVPPTQRDVNPFVSPMQSQIMEDLGEAVETAECEFHQLNARYKEIVSQIDGSRNLDSEGEEGSANNSTAQLSQALGPLLDELEAKSKQLNLLKQVYQTAAGSTINPIRRVVHSPEAIRRKTASLRVLNEYRQLEREARGSATTSPRAFARRI